jgi:hypothetical protein
MDTTLVIFFEIIRVLITHDEITTSVLPFSSAAKIFGGWRIMAVPGETYPWSTVASLTTPPIGKSPLFCPPAISRPAHLRWTARFPLLEWTGNALPVSELVQFLCRKESPQWP